MENTPYRPCGCFTKEVEQFQNWQKNATVLQNLALNIAHIIDTHLDPLSRKGLSKKTEIFSQRSDLSVGQLDAIITASRLKASPHGNAQATDAHKLSDQDYAALYSFYRECYYNFTPTRAP